MGEDDEDDEKVIYRVHVRLAGSDRNDDGKDSRKQMSVNLLDVKLQGGYGEGHHS